MASDKAHEICTILSRWYGSTATEFLDGTKLRLIPPIYNILSRDGKVKIATLIARQEALNSRLAYMKLWEFATNLLLDKVSPNCGKSMRQILMAVKSSKFPNCSAFHTIDGTWREEDNVTFTFVPENEDICRKLITGLIPFLRSVDPWFLS
jgi:hypothetical protein